MKKSRKILSVILVICMLAGFVPAAFAEGAPDSTDPVRVVAPSEEGKATVTAEYGSIDVKVGADPETPSYSALTAGAAEGGVANVNVSGDVSHTTEYNAANGVAAFTQSGGEVNVEVGGNVTAASTFDGSVTAGVIAPASVSSTGGGKVEVAVHSDVSAEGTDATGVNVQVAPSGETSVTVDGKVTAAGTEESTGVSVAAAAYNGEAKASVTVGGDVTSTGGSSDGAYLVADRGGQAELTVKGDLSGGTNGIRIYDASFGDSEAAPGQISVVVEGTVKGGENCILLDEVSSAEGIEITVWKAEPVNGSIVAAAATDESAEGTDPDAQAKAEAAAAALEKSINYIIKADKKADGGIFTLDGITEISGYDTAHEADIVTLKITVQNGYRLLGAYNGTEPILKQDSAGNYYLEVPKGGGVHLTIRLEKLGVSVESSGGAGAIASRQLKGAWLYLYSDRTYLMVFGDGASEKGTYDFRDGALVFTSRDGRTFEAAANADGNYVYNYVRSSGAEFAFTLSKTFTARTLHAAEKI